MFCLMLMASLSVEVSSFRVFVSTSPFTADASDTDMKAFSIIDSKVSEERANFETSSVGISGEVLYCFLF